MLKLEKDPDSYKVANGIAFNNKTIEKKIYFRQINRVKLLTGLVLYEP